MAIFRKVHVAFWKDSFIETLTPEQKYFYLYLITNSNTTQCGIYEISIRQMCFDTGYNNETIEKLLKYFTSLGKLKYSEKTQEVALKNWGKYNDSTSPKVKACIQNELKKVKNTVLIQYVYSIDTHSQEEEEEEQEEEREESREKITLADEKENIGLVKTEESEKGMPPLEIVNHLAKSNLYRQPTIPTLQAVIEFFNSSGGTKEMAENFYNKNEGVGWFLRGSPITNFRNLVPGFITNWNKNEQNARNTGNNSKNNNGAKQGAGGKSAGFDLINQALASVRAS